MSEYTKAWKDFFETINQQLEGRHILQEQAKSINNSLNELAKEEGSMTIYYE